MAFLKTWPIMRVFFFFFYAPGALEPISGDSEDIGPGLSYVCKGCLILGRFHNVVKSQSQNGNDSDDDVDDGTRVS